MTVHQIEQFYIHVDTKEATKDTLTNVKHLLIENDHRDYHFCDGFLVVDGFESHCEAVCIDELIADYLESGNEQVQ